jgi:hypothetical protein
MAEAESGTDEADVAGSGTTGGGGPGETALAVVVCAVAMFLPVLIIERGYENFVSAHGAVKEGAAGTTLALAVVVRTVLRNFTRTSTRAGLRTGIKSSMGGVVRVTTRTAFASLLKTALGGTDDTGGAASPSRPYSNLASLVLGSLLLYASWVIVIGLGQPFSDLLTAEQAVIAEARDAESLARARASSRQPGVIAYELSQRRDQLRDAVSATRRALKAARDPQQQALLADELSTQNADFLIVQSELSDALMRSGGRIATPYDPLAEGERDEAAKLQRWLFTRAPFTGAIGWDSPVIWVGAALIVLPLWCIFLAQAGVARLYRVPLRHETGLDGGLIQLYFAGAFSFMPLSSDVVVEGSRRQSGIVSLAGILVPTAISIGLWLYWKLDGETRQFVLLASDAFLIYPLVQVFPLEPLDGIRLWRWRRGLWLATFFFVMGTFVFMGSEGLKHVI